MPDQNLRKAIIRLAHEKPELREKLLPLLKEADQTKEAAGDVRAKKAIREAQFWFATMWDGFRKAKRAVDVLDNTMPAMPDKRNNKAYGQLEVIQTALDDIEVALKKSNQPVMGLEREMANIGW